MEHFRPILKITLFISTIASFTLEEPPQVDVLDGDSHHFSIEYCSIAIPSRIVNMNTHCYCFYNKDTQTSFDCSIPGPTFIFHNGTQFTLTWHNRMTGDSISDPSYFNNPKDLDITNIHTHGLHVSPIEDDVSVEILPQQYHTYKYTIPSDHYPGTHWLHAHHHGSASFQITSGLFSALLMKYSEDDMLDDDSLINMEENVLLFHFYYVITTDICDCSNVTQWQTYFYYPPQFELEDCISGKLCFQVFSHCYEYCSMPEAQRSLSGFTYDIQSDYGDNFQLFLVNGQFEPVVNIDINTFRRLRFVNVMTQYYIQYKFPISECVWYIIAIDGIFLDNDEVRSINSYPYYGYYLLAPGGRVDVIVKCFEIGFYSIITSEDDHIDADLVNIGRAPSQHILFTIRVSNDNSNAGDDDSVTDLPTSYPERPDYLKDLLSEETNVCGCNYYFENNNNTKPITWNETQCGIVLNMNDDHNINGLLFNPERPTTSLEYGKVYEFVFIPHMHPYHQHIIPFQIQTDIGTNGFQAKSGDWYDTVGGPRLQEFKFRTYPIDYTGKQIMHCHQLTHEDRGMMTFANILQPHQICNVSSGEVIGDPTQYPTRAPSARPTRSPTMAPSARPTRSPTDTPTDTPTPAPTENPTYAPTDTPTMEPTAEPTETPTAAPTDIPSIPSLPPTAAPTDTPTQEPTAAPTTTPSNTPTYDTPNPTTYAPTPSPLREMCTIEGDLTFDFIVLFDNSCGLSHDVCEDFLEFVGEVISSITDDNMQTRVQTMATRGVGEADTIVLFDNVNLQTDIVEYVRTVRNYGDCTQGGYGNTDLKHALHDALIYFDLDDTRIDKIIVINACLDDREQICEDIAPSLREDGIDSYIINFVGLSNATNVITSAEAADYLLCVADYNPERICVGDDMGDDDDDDADIIDGCLAPQVCSEPTESPSAAPTGHPTPEPTRKPTKAPSMDPTDVPTPNPTPDPTERPTETPTEAPIASPTESPTSYPTYPSLDPTFSPTVQCFPGQECDSISDCCADGSTQTALDRGIICSCYTKSSQNYYDYRCCIAYGFEGCAVDGDCCQSSVCYYGKCVHYNHPTREPTTLPTKRPTDYTLPPTSFPTTQPTFAPTDAPTPEPTSVPSTAPSEPSPEPTYGPTYPTPAPTNSPTMYPTDAPTVKPTKKPTSTPTSIPTSIPTLKPSKQCFLSVKCEETEECCEGSEDIEGLLRITCSHLSKLSTGLGDQYCCLIKGNPGCSKDNDCCKSRTVCYNNVCVDRNDPIQAEPTTFIPTSEPTHKPTTEVPTEVATTTTTTTSTTADDTDKCFITSTCDNTEECCTGDIDEGVIGVTCSGWTKMNEVVGDAKYCCVKKNHQGCKTDNDCCRIRSECVDGWCVNSS